ncbi:MAG: [FeFe] hydrogenase H-cluster radical SAM maturase HydE [Candidatus Nanoarchaeia archaeon]
MTLENILTEINAGRELNHEQIIFLLSLQNKEEIEALYKKAYEIKTSLLGKKVYFRGLIEFSNICEKDCSYCGIRKSNKNLERFMMTEDEIISEAKFALENNYGSIVLQSGERTDKYFVDFVENIVRKIKGISEGKLGITLCLGEQTEETYKKWFSAGAHRYLLRIETSNPELYKKIHPPDHSFENRKKCLQILRECGYQVGTGVMIGIPGQTIYDLASDILFFKEMDVDMIGMGPYIPHKDTPLGKYTKINSEDQLELGLKMIAVARICLKDVNIASTTALQALSPTGRELGILAGANIIMPNLTETKYRPAYKLYDGKPCLDENSAMCKSCLQKRIEAIGETIAFGEWGDSKHFAKRKTILK